MNGEEIKSGNNTDVTTWTSLSFMQPKPTLRLRIHYGKEKGANFTFIECNNIGKLPNWWFRMWYWLLLGWKWEKMNND